MTGPRVWVVIPTRNGGPRLLRVMAALLAQEMPEPFEILVVDSSSTDGTPEALAKLGLRVLRVPRVAFDHGATRNYGIGMASGEIVALLVQDALPASSRWLANLVLALDADPEAAGAYSRQIPRPDHPAFVRAPIEGWIAGSSEPRVQTLTADAYASMTPSERLGAVTFDDVSSAVKKCVWRRHPFAHARFAEDLEWSRRVLLHGYRILYVPSSVVIHSHDRGSLHELRRTYVCHRTLHGLFGTRLVPDGASLLRGLGVAARANRSHVREGDGRGLGRAVDLACATLHGFASALGQYLGPRATPTLDALLDRDP